MHLPLRVGIARYLGKRFNLPLKQNQLTITHNKLNTKRLCSSTLQLFKNTNVYCLLYLFITNPLVYTNQLFVEAEQYVYQMS